MKVLTVPSSGSQAGTTASHNRFGQYTRSRRAPVQPIGNGRRSIVRANFKAASSGFSNLTGAQIAAWNAAGLAHPRVDSLGQTIKLTGSMLYVSINAALQNVNQPIVTDPPADWTIAPMGTVQVVAQAGAFLALFPDGVPADTTILVASSRPVAGGVSFMKTFCQLAFIQAGDFGIDLTAAQIAQFGDSAVGQQVYYRLTPINEDGVTGTPNILADKKITPVTIPTPTLTSPVTGEAHAVWTGGGSYTAWAFDVTQEAPLAIAVGFSAGGVSPQDVTGLTTGDLVYVRITDGTSWSPPSNTLAIM